MFPKTPGTVPHREEVIAVHPDKETFSTGVEIGISDPNRFVELAERISELFSEVAYDSWEPSYGLSK